MLGEFGKQHYSSMAVRRDFAARVYGEVEAWNAKHGNVAGARSHIRTALARFRSGVTVSA